MEKVCISVIVPVYNAECYLDRCIQSIVDQTYTDLEIILVEDGSPDHSGEICDAWAKKDSRIRVIHQENAGGGAARNKALSVASGEYIAFVDSDDYLSKNMYASLIEQFDDGTDIVECGYLSVYDDGAVFDQPVKIGSYAYSAREAMREHIADRCFRQLIWNKLYRRRVIQGVLFPVGKKIDDEFWMYQVIGKARGLKRIDTRLYAYRQQEQSVMHSLDARRRLEAVEAKELRHTYIQENMPELIEESCCNLWFTVLYQGQRFLKNANNWEQRELFLVLRDVLKQHPLCLRASSVSMHHRVWLHLAGISLKGACYLRNMLHIGL